MKQNKRKRNKLWTAIAATWQRWKRRHRTAAQTILADEELWLQALMKWLTRTLKYPEFARQHKQQGRVMVSFIINKDGTIANPKIVQSVSAELDREALRVVRAMPAWKPGEDRGKPCRTLFCLPIVFKLS